ncbi:[protein-PII] uridylyltransferase [Rhodoferax antarcticus]|uniref:Bifunctional uridylyltransferase/uridylyl-removing enzyme n=1 Tax=Rhodoferax antarcticus ANT.BR TaxID=1111071 RepID=A0A1Q8YEL9_9BURK|nr:[protein-PII] uridylyltransferase [Rhodoferax antarcticus]APW46281.1 [protein-PII] uridylyltransferase [Rhodoferax antarcticus]OLP06491.1 [protein-P-II] uridylyltransferase [Rhodoferax antarcticus ANT.BR]
MTTSQIQRSQYRTEKAALLDALAASGASTRSVNPALQGLSRLADEALIRLWQQAGFSAPFALLAVGGFGRQEMYPHSDVDVLVLLPDDQSPEADPALKARIERFIGSCWDAGLEIGSSVRSVSECLDESAKDVTVQTALLEARLVIGSAALCADFQSAIFGAMDANAFFVAKTLEMEQRHNKFDDTPYALEPNCKESPGGLRDLQVILWVAKAAGLGANWNALAKAGLATAFEVKQIKHNEAVLRLIRARLHLISGRREDRLVFDLQTSVAHSFDYQPSDAVTDQRAFVRPSEKLMRHYYWAAKAVTQLNQILLLNIEERLNPLMHTTRPLRPLNDHFMDKAGMIEVVSDDLYQRNPHAILQTFLVYQTYYGIKGLSVRTLRALYNARNLMNADFRRDPVNRATFRQILMYPSGLTHALRLMNQTSVLGRYLWAFRRIVGQMQHDLFHVYTVDQHILMVLRNVRRFFIVEHAHEYPFCSQLASGWDKPWILHVAALFHDIAKGRGGDHSQLGALEVRRFCKHHGIAGADAELIEFLVREHLTMSRIAQKSDLSDPDVIAAFAQHVGSERALTALYLFTVADIRGTSPKVWNAWKGKLLEDLYRATSRALGGHAPDLHAEVQERQRDALVELALLSQPFESHKALWATLDVGYFMRHDAVEIAWHARMLSRHLGGKMPVVRARPSPVGEGLQVLVYTPDQTDLFARICGFFDHRNFSILDARIHTTQNGYALDTFQVVATYLPDHYRELVNMIESELTQVIATSAPLPAPSRGRVSRRVKSFPITPRVSLKPDEKAQRWLLNISASDRAGLLYSVALVLARHKVDLNLAKINTLGERVEDTFLIQGEALQNNRAQIEIETELLEALA